MGVRIPVLLLVLAAALACGGCAETTKAVNGAGRTVDGWFSPK